MAARKLHLLIYATIANCCLFLIVCSLSLSTNKWFSTKSEIPGDVSSTETKVTYGLFNGKKDKMSGPNTMRYTLKIVCDGFDGCMFSCGLTSEKRKQDLQNVKNGGTSDSEYCIDTDAEMYNFIPNAENQENPIFINFGLYIATIIFVILGMVFAIISGILALYNTYRTPFQPVLSVSGLFAWNGISAGFVLLAMIMWVIQFSTRLRKNAAVFETLSGSQTSEGTGSLGISFWILILPIIFAVANIAILKFRSWKNEQMDRINVTVMAQDKDNGDILLF